MKNDRNGLMDAKIIHVNCSNNNNNKLIKTQKYTMYTWGSTSRYLGSRSN